MVRPTVDSQQQIGETATPSRQFSFDQRLREIGMFFDGSDSVHQAMRTVVSVFKQNNIEYAIMGGMAVNAHRHRRTTRDVDFLVRSEGLAAIRQLVSQGIFRSVSGRSRRFIEPQTGVEFDILVTGLFPGSGKPGPIPFPDPAGVALTVEDLRYINLKTLIELKLAAHRYQDFADVVSLIRVHGLDESFQSQLHPCVHADYIECIEEMRREDEYEKRQDDSARDQATHDED